MLTERIFAEPVLSQPLSAEARASLLAAEREARRAGSDCISIDHLLLGLLDPPSIPLRLLFANLRVDVAELVAYLRAKIADPTTSSGTTAGFTDDITRTLERAATEAARAGGATIDSRHLLLGLLATSDSASTTRLNEAGLTLDAIRKQMKLRAQNLSGNTSFRSLLRAIKVSPMFLMILGVMLSSGALLAIFPDFEGNRALIATFLISGWAVQLCVHEFGHAAAAYLGGDREVVARGYLTLDPRYYSHWLLSIVLPLIFLFLGGLPLPGGAVMINDNALRSRKWRLVVSAAGPAGTFLCLLLISLPFLITGDALVHAHGQTVVLFSSLAGLGQILATVLVLNLIPIPPLDGFRILSYWLSDQATATAYRLGWAPMLFLFFIMGQDGPFAYVFWTITYLICFFLRLPYDAGVAALQMVGF